MSSRHTNEMANIDATLKNFKEEFQTLPTDVQYAIQDLIDEVGLNHTGGCPWRVTQHQFELALPVLQIISPSLAGEIQKNEYVHTFHVSWAANDFIVPDMNNLEEAFSPLADDAQPGQLCRSTSGDDWCVTPKSVQAEDETPMMYDDDCPSSSCGGRR
jgi:hypothetical protein